MKPRLYVKSGFKRIKEETWPLYDERYNFNRQTGRQTNLELFRIISMLIIVVHHYVVNSGLLDCVLEKDYLTVRDYFILILGWGGKTGINCFVLITGYFMCKSHITIKKWLKLFLEVEFYKIAIYLAFIIFGYETISIKGIAIAVFPFFDISDGFTSCFLLFYLFIPFLNKLIDNMSRREHLHILLLLSFIYTILPTFFKANVSFNYITWFCVIYLIASYIRLYPDDIYEKEIIWRIATLLCLLISWISVITIAFVATKINKSAGLAYYFVSDSNKILAVVTSISSFLYFKNINIKYSKVINTIAASTFGVLLIHANSNTMRQWLWHDICNNVGFYSSKYLVLHAVISILSIYGICTVIDHFRIVFIEKPFFKIIDRKLQKN